MVPSRSSRLVLVATAVLSVVAATTSAQNCVLFADSFDGPTLSPAWNITTSGAGSASASSGHLVLVAPGAVGTVTTAAISVPGSDSWSDYTVDVDFLANPSSCQVYPSAEVIVRLSATGYYSVAFNQGLVGQGLVSLLRDGNIEHQVVGTFPLSAWHHAQIQLSGATIAVTLDAAPVFSWTLLGAATHPQGTVGLFSWWCSTNLHDDFSVTAACPPPPTITGTSLNFSSLFGGVAMTIFGTGFDATASATIGGVPLVGATVLSPTAIQGSTPALPNAQVADVSVSTLGGTATLPAAITYGPAMVGISGTPQVGSTFELRIASYPSAPIVLLADVAPGSYQLGSYGFAGLAFTPALTPVLDFFGAFTGVPDPSAATNAAGGWSQLVALPNDPSLIGTTVYGQVFTVSFFPLPPNTLFWIGNVLPLTFVP